MRLLAALVLAGLAGLGGGYLWYGAAMTSPVGEAGDAVVLTLYGGATWDDAAGELAGEGLNPHPLFFGLRARQRGKRVALKEGAYRFERTWTPDQIMDVLAEGPKEKDDGIKRWQIIPGHNIWQANRRMKRLEAGGDLLTLASDAALMRRLKLPTPRERPKNARTLLEGYLYPDTYHLDRETPTAEAGIGMATRRFRKVFDALKIKHARSYARLMAEYRFTDHDFVTLASLIEKEVVVASEAPHVAGVFYNRLKRRQRLETDPTLVYAPDTYDAVPAPRHRKDRTNRYNTYAYAGLPPGPICNPASNALEAALAPEKTDHIYFVAMRDGSGRHIFSKTHDEHRKNIEKYLIKPRSF
ncbi:MAG: UPF0755 protein [Myxococcota bacterium]|jgi:UPF0755 protein